MSTDMLIGIAISPLILAVSALLLVTARWINEQVSENVWRYFRHRPVTSLHKTGVTQRRAKLMRVFLTHSRSIRITIFGVVLFVLWGDMSRQGKR